MRKVETKRLRKPYKEGREYVPSFSILLSKLTHLTRTKEIASTILQNLGLVSIIIRPKALTTKTQIAGNRITG